MKAWHGAWLVGVAACGGAQTEAPDDGARVAITVSPLQLPEVTDVEYRLWVEAGGQTVWSEVVRSSRYGDGSGALSYIGPCDASAGDNTVLLDILGMWSGTTPLDFVDPTRSAPLRRTAPCEPNRDTSVRFDITVMRSAAQGFFDVAVRFDDIYCSAKLDCERADGTPNLLLFDPDGGGRVPSAVLAVACTAGPGSATELWFDPVRLDCGGAGTVDLPIAGPTPGNVFDTNPPGPLMQVATYRGAEALTQGQPATDLAKVYFDTAFALDALPVGTTCSLTASVTAHDGPDATLTTPPGTYPVIRVAIPVLADASGLVCGTNPLDDPSAPEGTGVFSDYTAADAPETFSFAVRRDGAGGVVLVHSGAIPSACDPSPCQHQGACTDVGGAAVCACPPGYDGDRCQLDIDECAGDPCGPGTCDDGIATYTCACEEHHTFDGVTCVAIDYCAPNPCANGGTCELVYPTPSGGGGSGSNPECLGTECGAPSSPIGFACVCPPAWGGSTCASPRLVVTPSGVRLFVADVAQLVASGGQPPYDFEVTSGLGAIDDSGRFVASDLAGDVQVTVTDSASQTAVAALTVVDVCDASSTWTTALGAEAGYTTWNQLAPIRVSPAVDAAGDLYLPLSAVEGDGGRAWVLLGRDAQTGAWHERDRWRRSGQAQRLIQAVFQTSARVLALSSPTGVYERLSLARASTDGGQTWSEASFDGFAVNADRSQGYDQFLAESGDRLWIAGTVDVASQPHGVLLTSVDDGATWTEVHRFQALIGGRTSYRGAFVDGAGRLVLVGDVWSNTESKGYLVVRTSTDGVAFTTDLASGPGGASITCDQAALADDDTLVVVDDGTVYRKTISTSGGGVVTLSTYAGTRLLFDVAVRDGRAYVAGLYNATASPLTQRWAVWRVDVDTGVTALVDDYRFDANDSFARAHSMVITAGGRLVVAGQDQSQTRSIVRTSTDGVTWQTIPIGGNLGKLRVVHGPAVTAGDLVGVGQRVYRLDFGAGSAALVDDQPTVIATGNNAARAVAVDEVAGAVYATGIGGTGLATDGMTSYVGVTRADRGDGLGWVTIDTDDIGGMGTSFLDILQVGAGTHVGRLLTWGFAGDAVGMSFSPELRTSDDDGVTWAAQPTDDFQRRASALAQASDGTLFSVGADTMGMSCNWIVRQSTDGGDTWAPFDAYASSGMFCMGERDHQPFDVAVDAQGNVWVVGVRMDMAPWMSWTVRKWSAATSTWATVDVVSGGGGESGALSIAIDAADNVWVGGYGEVRRSTDGGASWESMKAGQTFIGVAAAPGGHVFAVESEGGSQGGAVTVHRFGCVP